MKTDEIKQLVKSRYSKYAQADHKTSTSCCKSTSPFGSSYATEHGLYSAEELTLIPSMSRRLSRGCGNPTGFAHLQPGETVVDFGCGAGMDLILAAHGVTQGGKVIGIDFSPRMISRAKQAVSEAKLTNSVNFVVSDLEQVAVPDNTADVVISNCVINLCLDKLTVFREIFRILKPGGRVAIADIMYQNDIDSSVKSRFQDTWAGCVAGSIVKNKYFEIVENVGFTETKIVARHLLQLNELENMACCPGPEFTPPPDNADLDVAKGKVASIKFTALKPTTYHWPPLWACPI